MAGAGTVTAREIITSYDGPKLRIMEVCGTHTHEIFRLGIWKPFAITFGKSGSCCRSRSS